KWWWWEVRRLSRSSGGGDDVGGDVGCGGDEVGQAARWRRCGDSSGDFRGVAAEVASAAVRWWQRDGDDDVECGWQRVVVDD
ncbi:hypothetical protein Tco_0833443, partial [Tanacetum coccineum]